MEHAGKNDFPSTPSSFASDSRRFPFRSVAYDHERHIGQVPRRDPERPYRLVNVLFITHPAHIDDGSFSSAEAPFGSFSCGARGGNKKFHVHRVWHDLERAREAMVLNSGAQAPVMGSLRYPRGYNRRWYISTTSFFPMNNPSSHASNSRRRTYDEFPRGNGAHFFFRERRPIRRRTACGYE